MPIWSVLICWRDLTNTQQDKKLPSICFSHVAHFMFFSLFLERLNCNHSQKIGRMNCSHNTIWNDMVFHAATCGANKKLINCWMSALNAKVSAIAGKKCKSLKTTQNLSRFAELEPNEGTLNYHKFSRTEFTLNPLAIKSITDIAGTLPSPPPSSVSKASRSADQSPSLREIITRETSTTDILGIRIQQ